MRKIILVIGLMLPICAKGENLLLSQNLSNELWNMTVMQDSGAKIYSNSYKYQIETFGGLAGFILGGAPGLIALILSLNTPSKPTDLPGHFDRLADAALAELGIIIGVPIGVKVVGKKVGDKGSYWKTLVGTLFGNLLGILIGFDASTTMDRELNAGYLAGIAFGSICAGCTVAGAVIGYHQ